MNKLWKKFEKSSSKCYTNMIQSNAGMDDWNEGYSALLEVVNESRSRKPGSLPELYLLDEETDYQYDVAGWLEDYLDELDMHEKYEELQKTCEQLLELFQWKEDDPGQLYFQIAFAMRAQGRKEEAHAFCEEWYQKQSGSMLAATAFIYAKIAVGDLAGAEQLVDKYISEDTVCTDENDIIFTAAARLYKESGNKKAEKRINQAIQRYEKELEEYFAELDDDEMDFNMDGDDLPFN